MNSSLALSFRRRGGQGMRSVDPFISKIEGSMMIRQQTTRQPITHPQTNRVKLPIDTVLFGTMLALLVVGLWMVFDASYVKTLDNAKMGHDAFYFVKKQSAGVVVGFGAVWLMMRLGYW